MLIGHQASFSLCLFEKEAVPILARIQEEK